MRSVFLLCSVILTSGCGGQSVKNEVEVDSSIKQSELLTGSWMSDSYLQKIEITESIYTNKNNEPRILGFLVKKESLKNENGFIYGFTSHEGGIEIPIYFDHSSNKFAYDKKRANQSIIVEDSFEMSLIDDNKVEIKFHDSTEIYRKIEDEQTELRRILFEGEFKSNKDEKFTFNRTGALTGFDDKLTFEIIYDFSLNIEFDAIVIYSEKELGNWSDGEIYKYEFKSDTLKLYSVETNWETLNHKIGKLRYNLKKVGSSRE